MKVTWQGVMPAITTPFTVTGAVDDAFFASHCKTLVAAGCTGLVPLGSLGESATLSFDEKVGLLRVAVGAVGEQVPIVAGIASLSTAEAQRLAVAALDAGCSGVMVLPPYVYASDWREMKAHVVGVLKATELPAMLYNNPVSYRTDFLPEQIAELAHEHAQLVAVKESSTDVRRVTAIRALLGDRLHLLVGVDDGLVEAVQVGAEGWIAGLVNAFPEESVELFRLAVDARQGRGDATRLTELYHWFLPLLRLDTVPKFVQLIKLAQEMVGLGNARVRGPRLELVGGELATARHLIEEALRTRPTLHNA